jgi:CheY-like chemotaxis protein
MNEGTVDIVLVEDNPYDAELIARVLKKEMPPIHIKVFDDGEEALEFIRETRRKAGEASVREQPRLILLDLKLPKVTGLEVLRHIKTDDLTKGIPVVVFTSSAEERDRLESYRLGADSYVVKPVNFADFRRSVIEIAKGWLKKR